MNLGKDSYDIIVERGILLKANKHLNLNRRVLVVSDAKNVLFVLSSRAKHRKVSKVSADF